MAKIATIPLSQIRPNPVALRAVDKSDPKYVELVSSIGKNGVLNAISVRELTNPDNPSEPLYGLIDGLHRFTGACDAGLNEINATITNLDDAEVEEAQIIANVQKIETKPVEYTNALRRLMTRNPTLTISELADRLSKSISWLTERMNLVKLVPSVSELVNDSKINLSNAYALAKLPPDEQATWVDRAMTLPPSEFVPQANTRIKEIRDAKRQGRDPNQGFTPVAFMQKMSAIKEESQSRTYASQLVSESTDPFEAFALALAWVQHLDPVSVKVQVEEHQARLKAQEEAKQKRAQEREAKKAKEAAETQVAAVAA